MVRPPPRTPAVRATPMGPGETSSRPILTPLPQVPKPKSSVVPIEFPPIVESIAPLVAEPLPVAGGTASDAAGVLPPSYVGRVPFDIKSRTMEDVRHLRAKLPNPRLLWYAEPPPVWRDDKPFSLESIAVSVVAEVCREAVFAVATPIPKPEDEDREDSGVHYKRSRGDDDFERELAMALVISKVRK